MMNVEGQIEEFQRALRDETNTKCSFARELSSIDIFLGDLAPLYLTFGNLVDGRYSSRFRFTQLFGSVY
jgi:hypothetical protein